MIELSFVVHSLLTRFRGNLIFKKQIIMILFLAVAQQSQSKEVIKVNFQPGELIDECHKILTHIDFNLDAISKIKKSDRNVKNTLLAFEDAVASFNEESEKLVFLAFLSDNLTTRTEAFACRDLKLSKMIDIYSQKQIYQGLKRLKPFSKIDKRLIQIHLKKFKAGGADLDESKSAALNSLQNEIIKKSSEYLQNLFHDETVITLSKTDLEGVPESVANGLISDDEGNKVLLAIDFDTVGKLIKTMKNGEARKKLLSASQSVAPKNILVLKDIANLRNEVAVFLGFKNYAQLRLNDQMVGTPEEVHRFLNELQTQINPFRNIDIQNLLTLKKQLDPQSSEIFSWDTSYFTERLPYNGPQIVESKIKEFFPLNTVINGTLEIYSQMFQIHFNKLTDVEVWASGVDTYQVVDNQSGKELAIIFLDLIQRQSKTNVATMSITSHRIMPNGGSINPISIISLALPEPSNGLPTLLSFNQMKTLFHEFGHLMQDSLSRPKYFSLSNHENPRDFTEVASTMMENFVWNSEILKKLSGHYLDSSQKLPNDYLTYLLKVNSRQRGIALSRQISLSLFDLKIHSEENADIQAVYNRSFEDSLSFAPAPGNCYPCQFSHMINPNYPAAYYGYLWSGILSLDLFSIFQDDGTLDLSKGMKLRKEIFEVGSARDVLESVEKFLGRKTNSDAFIKDLENKYH